MHNQDSIGSSNMSIKFIFALLAVIAYQGVSCSPMPEASADGIMEQIQQALQKLREILEKALANAQVVLQETIEKLKEAASEIIGEGLGKIIEAIANAKSEIEKLAEEAAQVGADISVCLENVDEDLEAIRQRVSDQLKHCVSAAVTEASNIVDSAIADLQEQVGNLITELGNRVAACGQEEKPLPCLIQALKDIGKQAVELPKVIAAKVVEVVGELQQVQAKLAECRSTAAINAASESAAVVEKARECIKSKLPQ